MADEAQLDAPVLLLAMPQVLDPFFHKSVVLLVHHNDEGSLGFIVNRPTGIHIHDILNGMKITWQGDPETVVFFGGPVQPQLGTVLFSPSDREVPEAATEVMPGTVLTQHSGDLESLAAEPPEAFRLYLGYAGWGAGQLMEEILRNDWLTAPVTPELLFTGDPAAAWEEALQSVGVNPEALPSWTVEGDDQTTN